MKEYMDHRLDMSRQEYDAWRNMDCDEFDKEMCSRYPEMFQNRNKPMTETCMCWGFAVGKGWQPILADLFSKMKLLGDKFNAVAAMDQIKKKFATLRVYSHVEFKEPSTTKEENLAERLMDMLVASAETLSGQICERCGENEEVSQDRDYGWIKTLCPACKKLRAEEFPSRLKTTMTALDLMMGKNQENPEEPKAGI